VSKGAKIAIGCAVAFVGATGIAVVAVMWGAYWFKGKVEEKVQEVGGSLTAKTGEIARYQERADANPYTPPADGVIPEERLVKFLEVRKQMYGVYQLHRADIESAGQNKEATLSDIAKFASLVGDLQLAKSKALAGVGMSGAEYISLQMAVYQSSWASDVQKETGKQFGENLSDAARQSRGSMRKGIEEAGKAGYPVDGKVSDEDLAKAEAAVEELAGKAKAVDVPQANIDLFRKHEAEITRYAMGGLTFLGL
jgi:hypothetical protein